MKIEYRGMEHVSGKKLDDLIIKIQKDVASSVTKEFKKKVGFDIGFSLFIFGEKSTHYISNIQDEAALILIADVVAERFSIVELQETENRKRPN